jgi:hypothetical protein
MSPKPVGDPNVSNKIIFMPAMDRNREDVVAVCSASPPTDAADQLAMTEIDAAVIASWLVS